MPAWQCVRYALRSLGKSPGFTSVVILILAFGIGANTTIFSLVNSLLLRPLAYKDPDRLLLITEVPKNGPQNQIGCLSYPHFTSIQEGNRVFSGLTAYTSETFNLTGRGEAEQISAARVSWNFFDVLGIKMARGRGFLAEEDRPGGKPVVLISDALWSRRFARRAGILGQPIALDSKSYTIVGVLPASFEFGFLGTQVEVWAPQVDQLGLFTPEQARGGVCFLDAVGRIAPGVSTHQAQAQMDVLYGQYMRQFPKLPDASPDNAVELAPLRDQLVGSFRPTLLLLCGAVALVLLIACANVAGLLLARALARKKEFAIRIALGASRTNLILQLLTESLVLSLLSGLAGTLLAIWGIKGVASAAENILPRAGEIKSGMDFSVLCFSLGVSVLAAILFGLTPALQVSRTNVSAALREEGRGSTGTRKRNLLRNALVAGQAGLSVVLLVGAGLLIRSFIRLQTQPPGFEPQGLLTMNLSLPSTKYEGWKTVHFFDQLLERIRAVPGVQSAAASSALPANPVRFSPILAEGQPEAPLPERPVVAVQMITPSYLQTMRIPLIRGREFTAGDKRESPPVILITRAFARRFFPKQDPIGRHVALGRRAARPEIVGVIGDVRNISISTDPQPEILVPFAQLSWPSLNLLIRTAGDPHTLIEPVRRQIGTLDADQPATSVQTMEELLAGARSQPRLMMTLLLLFAVCALALAIVGLYSVISYSVSQRTMELGVRMALGATRARVLGLVIGQGVGLALLGIGVGLTLSFLLTRLMASLLYGVSVTDPWTFVASPLLFLLFTLLASYLPARRATRIDPVEALRHE